MDFYCRWSRIRVVERVAIVSIICWSHDHPQRNCNEGCNARRFSNGYHELQQQRRRDLLTIVQGPSHPNSHVMSKYIQSSSLSAYIWKPQEAKIFGWIDDIIAINTVLINLYLQASKMSTFTSSSIPTLSIDRKKLFKKF